MFWHSRATGGKFAAALAASGGLALVVAACGSSQETGGSGFPTDGADASIDGNRGTGTNSDTGGGGFDFDSSRPADVVDIDAYYFNDPPPAWCGPDGGATPPPAPGGTAECPADKNRQGCDCPTEGATAACWTGPRVNRNLGICKDGVTTCLKTGELTKAWGPCVGAVLPQAGATKGAPACKCFSKGEWKIANVSPCFTYLNGALQQAHSTYLDGNVAKCEAQMPTQDFSTDTLKVDCEGTFDLCFVIKAGDMASPKATDCELMAPVCTGATDYPTKNAVTTFPNLKAWKSNGATCAQRFIDQGGYAELSVKGTSYSCDTVDDGAGGRFVFQRFKYCPMKCNEAAHKNDPECINCTNGAAGSF